MERYTEIDNFLRRSILLAELSSEMSLYPATLHRRSKVNLGDVNIVEEGRHLTFPTPLSPTIASLSTGFMVPRFYSGE